jgi:RAB6A-GEF complex partner protein 1
MYWPVGAPRIYAASSSKTPKDRVHESDDDAESRETTEGSGSLLNAPSIDSEGGLDEDGERRLSGVATPMTPMTPGIKPVEHESQPRPSARLAGQDESSPALGSIQADKEPLLALRISRTGHLFAVITATSLTVWQTKVRRP